MVELVGAKCAWVARVLAEAADVGAVVYDIGTRLFFGTVGEGFDDALQSAVESLGEVEGLVQEAVSQLTIVCSDLVDADLGRLAIAGAGTDIRHTVSLRNPLLSITRISGR